MNSISSNAASSPPPASDRRIVVLAVPPVDELDLVGPLQVLSSVNRLAGRTIYTMEMITTATTMTIEGEGGVLTFLARGEIRRYPRGCAKWPARREESGRCASARSCLPRPGC